MDTEPWRKNVWSWSVSFFFTGAAAAELAAEVFLRTRRLPEGCCTRWTTVEAASSSDDDVDRASDEEVDVESDEEVVVESLPLRGSLDVTVERAFGVLFRRHLVVVTCYSVQILALKRTFSSPESLKISSESLNSINFRPESLNRHFSLSISETS